jgi:hypothetical protein
MEGLMRGDLPSRYRAYAVGRQWGWLSANDVRSMESMNPIDNGDVYLHPLNMTAAGADNPDVRDEQTDKQEDSTSIGAKKIEALRLQQFVHAAAERVVRKEVKVLTRIAEQANGHFSEQVEEFYRAHSAFVAETMRVPEQKATAYAEGKAQALAGLSDPAARSQVISEIETRGPKVLTELALKEIQ